jgi:hypothetical protein
VCTINRNSLHHPGKLLESVRAAGGRDFSVI